MIDELPHPPTLSTLQAQITDLRHQSQAILFLSASNMILNVLTIGIGFLLAV